MCEPTTSRWLGCRDEIEAEHQLWPDNQRRILNGVGAEGGIVSEGVAQVVDDWAIPFSSRSSGGVGELVLFVARRFISPRFAALLNTGITPVSSPCAPPPPGATLVPPTLAAGQCLSGKALYVALGKELR